MDIPVSLHYLVAYGPMLAAILSMLVIVWAVVVVGLFKPADLSDLPRQVG